MQTINFSSAFFSSPFDAVPTCHSSYSEIVTSGIESERQLPMDPAEDPTSNPSATDRNASDPSNLHRLELRIANLEQAVAALTAQLAAGSSATREALLASAERPTRIFSTGLPPVTATSHLEVTGLDDPKAIEDAALTTQNPPPPKQDSQSVMRNEPRASKDSLEDRLGAQLFNRIGIVALLLGATWFLKLAMDNHWIGPLGRVLVGLVAGAALVLWSERFRRQGFAAFSYSLKAIGSGVLYLSLWASFQLYHLLPAPAAFALMLAITAWNAFMAWSQGSELLAVYALAGAFATPLLLSTGGNHQVFLFSYLLAIDLVTTLLVRIQQRRPDPWPHLLLIAQPATALYFIGWYSSFYSADQLLSTSLFVALFFLVFLAVPLLPFAQEAEDFNRSRGIRDTILVADIFLPLANAIFGSLALYSVLEDGHQHATLPWFSLLFACVYVALMRLPQRPAARAIHLSLAVVFLTIAIPLKASGAAISLAWLAEAVALLWAAHHLGHTSAEPASISEAPYDPVPLVLRRLGTVALLLGFIGIALHPLWIYPQPTTPFLNARFASALAGIAAFAAAVWIALQTLHRSPAEAPFDPHSASKGPIPHWLQIAAGSVIALNLLALEAGILEIGTLWYRPFANPLYAESRLETALSISAFLALYGAALLTIGFFKRSAFLRWQALILLLIAIAKTFLHDISHLSAGYRVVGFLGLGALLMAISFAYQKDWLNLRDHS